LQQIGNDSVSIGAGLPGAQNVTTISQAITWFDNLPTPELTQVEYFLEQAGYYTDANGNPLQTAAALGTLDDQGRRAFLNALIASYSAGTSLTDTLSQAIQTGQGAALRNTLPSAVTGGFNTYNIDLTNPNIQQGANQIFQATLGRNATPGEVAGIVSTLQQQETSQGLTQEQGAEQASQQKYQAQVTQRNIAYNYETANKVAGGALPNGPITNTAGYAAALLEYMKMPVTASNVAMIMGLSTAMGNNLTQGMNPLGTQNVTPGSTANAQGVAQFTSWAASIQATAQALLTGPYTNLIASLTDGQGSQAAGNSSVQAEISKWTGGTTKNITKQVKAAQTGANEAAFYYGVNQQQQGVGAQQGTPMGLSGNNAQNVGMQSGQSQSPAVAATFAAAAANPAVAAYLRQGALQAEGTFGVAGGVPAADVASGQLTQNPGDVYGNPTTVYTTNPETEGEAEYNAATTGANRIPFGAENYLNAFNTIAGMINQGYQGNK
jgi:hypothetical protein